MRAPALAMLLILCDLTAEEDWKWVNPAIARKRYGISEDTWSKGLAEVKQSGLVEVKPKPVEEAFEWRRTRNTYRVNRYELRVEGEDDKKKRVLVLPARLEALLG